VSSELNKLIGSFQTPEFDFSLNRADPHHPRALWTWHRSVRGPLPDLSAATSAASRDTSAAEAVFIELALAACRSTDGAGRCARLKATLASSR